MRPVRQCGPQREAPTVRCTGGAGVANDGLRAVAMTVICGRYGWSELVASTCWCTPPMAFLWAWCIQTNLKPLLVA
eukprot:15441800-Alexandrium_andersonii.AAC.1